MLMGICADDRGQRELFHLQAEPGCPGSGVCNAAPIPRGKKEVRRMHSLMRTTVGLATGFAMAGSAAAAELTPLADDGRSHQFEFRQMDLSNRTDLTSASNWAITRDVFPSETFGARMIARSTDGGLFILDGSPNGGFLFGGGDQDGGANSFTGAGTLVSANQVDNGDGTESVTVSQRSADGSEILPAGFTSGGFAINSLRFDVGGFFAAADPVSYPGFSAADVNKTEIVLIADGAAIFVAEVPFPAGSPSSGAIDFSSGLSSTASITNVAGFGVDEVQFVYTLNVPTPGAASLFGLAGLLAVRRRR